MSPEIKLLLIAAAITVGGAWWGWWIMQPRITRVPPASKDTVRGNDAGWWS